MKKMGTGEPLFLEGETWRDIEDWPNYQISDFGRVKSLSRVSHRFNPHWGVSNPLTVREKILRQSNLYGRNRDGSKRDTPAAKVVSVLVDGKRKYQYVHILVMNAFIGRCPKGMECCHNDGNPTNNHVSNLRWDTHVSNVADSIRHGTFLKKLRDRKVA